MARFSVKRNFSFTRDILPSKSARRQALREAGLKLATKITNRTLSGKDENNRPFHPYSPEYQAAKKHGRSTVDLHLSGEMLADFGVIEATSDGVKLGFRTDESADKAHWHEEGAGRLPVRKFLGVTEKDAEAVVRAVEKLLK